MNKLTINIPDGFVIDKFDSKTGEVHFMPKPLNIKERIKNFEDVLGAYNLSGQEFDMHCKGMSADEIAYRKVKLIVNVFNEGWVPDWTNGNEGKYYPWFEMGSPSGVGFSYGGYGSWGASSIVGSRLCFKSSDLAKHAGNLFLDIYKDFLTLNS